METDNDNGRVIMEKIDKIRRRDPHALSMIENIVDDLLRATEAEEAAVQSLYMEIIKKTKQDEA